MNTQNIQRHIGTFSIKKSVLFNARWPVEEVMALVRVINVTRDDERDTFTYLALSNRFEPIQEGDEPPHYRVEFDSECGIVFSKVVPAIDTINAGGGCVLQLNRTEQK